MALLISGLETSKQAAGLTNTTIPTAARTKLLDFISPHGDCDDQQPESSFRQPSIRHKNCH
jgi:hypothetical protein